MASAKVRSGIAGASKSLIYLMQQNGLYPLACLKDVLTAC